MTDELGDLTELMGDNGKKRKLASSSNPLLMRLRLASLLITGHKDYPDALSRLTNMQVSIFALFDAIREKTIKFHEVRPLYHPSGSRYYATRALYFGEPGSTVGAPSSCLAAAPWVGGTAAKGGSPFPDRVPDVYLYFGLKTFTVRYKSLSQSIMGDARKEYLSGIEEKPVQLRYGSREDLDIPKPSLYETLTGKPKRGDDSQ
jgi:hypothetical protein